MVIYLVPTLGQFSQQASYSFDETLGCFSSCAPHWTSESTLGPSGSHRSASSVTKVSRSRIDVLGRLVGADVLLPGDSPTRRTCLPKRCVRFFAMRRNCPRRLAANGNRLQFEMAAAQERSGSDKFPRWIVLGLEVAHIDGIEFFE